MLSPRYWFVVVVILLSGCGNKHRVSLPAPTPARLGGLEEGVASWYGNPYHGRRTSNGEIYDMEQLTAAHQSLPFNTWVRVTNLENRRWVDVRINDRGPFVKDRVIDVSHAAAETLRMIGNGTARVRVEVVGVPGRPYEAGLGGGPLAMTPASYRPSEPETTPSENSLATAGGSGGAGSSPDGALEGVDSFAEVVHEGCPTSAFYAVQVGSFRELENAERMRGKMGNLYGVSRLVEMPTAQGNLYRVMVGQFGDAQTAQRLLESLAQDRYDGYVKRVDPSAATQCL